MLTDHDIRSHADGLRQRAGNATRATWADVARGVKFNLGALREQIVEPERLAAAFVAVEDAFGGLGRALHVGSYPGSTGTSFASITRAREAAISAIADLERSLDGAEPNADGLLL